LLLVALLALLIVYLIGLLAENQQLNLGYQANTASRRVLSIPYLGRLVYAREHFLVTVAELNQALALLDEYLDEVHRGL